MRILKTHGATKIRSGRMQIETNFHPGTNSPGVLALRLEDQKTYESVDGAVRLDPWISDEYGLIELTTGNCFLICGA